MTTGLVLSGGAATGLAHVGLWRALKEKNIKIDYIIGSSMGSIIASAMALGLELDYVENFAKSMTKDKILDPTWEMISKILYKLITGKPVIGLYDLKRVEKLLRKEFGYKTFKDVKIPLEIPAVNINNANKVYFQEGDIVNAILDSMCIPAVFQPKGKNLDGLLRVNFPVERAVEKCDKIIGMHFGYSGECDVDITKTNLLNVILQSFQIISKEQSFSDIQHAKISGKEIIAINPKIYNVGPFDFDKADEIIKRGYDAAMKALQ